MLITDRNRQPLHAYKTMCNLKRCSLKYVKRNSFPLRRFDLKKNHQLRYLETTFVPVSVNFLPVFFRYSKFGGGEFYILVVFLNFVDGLFPYVTEWWLEVCFLNDCPIC